MLAQGREGLPPVHGHGPGNTAYERHQPEQTLLYQLVEAHFPALVEHTCARKNRNYLPSRSCYHAPGATHPSPAGHVASFRGEGRAVAEPAFS